jgi:hypothetical protein
MFHYRAVETSNGPDRNEDEVGPLFQFWGSGQIRCLGRDRDRFTNFRADLRGKPGPLFRIPL